MRAEQTCCSMTSLRRAYITSVFRDSMHEQQLALSKVITSASTNDSFPSQCRHP